MKRYYWSKKHAGRSWVRAEWNESNQRYQLGSYGRYLIDVDKEKAEFLSHFLPCCVRLTDDPTYDPRIEESEK